VLCDFNTEGESASGDIAAAEQFPENVSKVISDDGHTDVQLHIFDETALYYRSLPNQFLDLKESM
jgi:hypothetical protein